MLKRFDKLGVTKEEERNRFFRRNDTVSLLPEEQTFPVISGVLEMELVSLIVCFSVNFCIAAPALFF